MSEWFVEWFDSPYYHVLYKSRSDEEAQRFIDNLETQLAFKNADIFCDMCCGRGRHAKYLNQKGFTVVGLDLALTNIEFAKKFENESLKFEKHDIRDIYKTEYFDIVLNLFTSFGYFENDIENQKAITSIAESIKSGGLLILDYMNSRSAVENFETNYHKNVQNIQFDIHKKIEKGYIYKKIDFVDQGQAYSFEEKVKLLFLDDFKHFFEKANLKLLEVFGDYSLNGYHDLSSERMIMVCQKL